jgi:hypothetical protein
MAYDFEESSGQRISYTPNADYTSKLAVAAWVNFEALSGSHQMHIVSKGKSDAGNDRNFSMKYTPAGGGIVRLAWTSSVGTFVEYDNTHSPSTAAWQLWYAEVDWSTNPDTALLWIAGVSKALTRSAGGDNTTPTTGATQRLSIGAEHATADNDNNFDGLIAEVALWNTLGGATRMNMLNAGFSPAFFKDGLVEYIPLIRSLHNLRGGSGTLSTSNPVVAPHPKIIYPSINDISTYTAQAPVVSDFLPRLSLLGVG